MTTMMISLASKKYSYLYSSLPGVIAKTVLIAFVLFRVPAKAQMMQQEQPDFPHDYPVIHPQFRQWASPALNNEASSVSPTLMWPMIKKAKGYDIRLSQDPGFNDKATISEQNIKWTIYSPHRELTKGKWYWQYRVHEGKWSDVLQFQITNASNKNFAPPVEKLWSSIPNSHPRVLIDAKSENEFRKQQLNSADAKEIFRKVAEWMDASPPDEEDGKQILEGSNETENSKLALLASEHASNKIYYAVDLFCKAYVLSGDKKYAGKGIAWAMSVTSWDPDGMSLLSDFGDARLMVAMALVFDTFHDLLDQSQKTTLLKAIDTRADRFYHEWVNNIDAKVLSNHVWQYILHYFFQTAIATYGETDNARNWIRYGYELWLARAPVLGGGDGAWCEGASYFRLNMETLLDMPTIIKEYTGYDFIANTKWYSLNPYWILYSFPPASSADGFGDDIEKIHSPGTEYLAYADALSKLTGNGLAAWYARKIEEVGRNKDKTDVRVNGVASYANKYAEKISLSDADMLRWFRMRYLHGVKSPAPIDPTKLPAAEIFRGTGVVDMHSDIADRDNDIMVSMRSSPYGSYGHLLGDQNTFNVLVGGDRFFYMSGHKIAMQDPHRLGWYKATQGHNGILIDDQGQPFNVEAYGYLPRFINGKNVSYAVGDASQAYASRTEKQQTGLTKFKRHLLFLHPGILLIYDELEADHPAKWSWLIHSPYKIEINASKNQFDCNSDNARSTTSLIADQKIVWALSDTFGIPVVNWVGREDEDGNLVEFKNDQWHLTASTTVKTNKMRFLAVMRINQKGEIEKTPVPYQLNSKGELIIDKWLIRAELDANKPPVLEAVNTDKHISFTSGADKIELDNKTFSGKTEGSSKLVELVNKKYVFSEAGDVIPDAVKDIPGKADQ